jgi:hypothetical protein
LHGRSELVRSPKVAGRSRTHRSIAGTQHPYARVASQSSHPVNGSPLSVCCPFRRRKGNGKRWPVALLLHLSHNTSFSELSVRAYVSTACWLRPLSSTPAKNEVSFACQHRARPCSISIRPFTSSVFSPLRPCLLLGYLRGWVEINSYPGISPIDCLLVRVLRG